MTRSEKYCPYCGSPVESMLSIESCARLLDCSPQFFRNLVRERRIGYAKVGRLVRIPSSEISKMIDFKPSLDSQVEEALG